MSRNYSLQQSTCLRRCPPFQSPLFVGSVWPRLSLSFYQCSTPSVLYGIIDSFCANMFCIFDLLINWRSSHDGDLPHFYFAFALPPLNYFVQVNTVVNKGTLAHFEVFNRKLQTVHKRFSHILWPTSLRFDIRKKFPSVCGKALESSYSDCSEMLFNAQNHTQTKGDNKTRERHPSS